MINGARRARPGDRGAQLSRSHSRETIALAVAAANHGDCCQAAHTIGAQDAGLTQEQTLQVRHGDIDDVKLATLARLLAARRGASFERAMESATGRSNG